MITMLIFSFNKTEKSFAHNKNDFSELLYEYRNSSFEAYDGENNVTDKFREILKLDDETVIRKIQKEFKLLKIRRIYIEPKLMYSYVPPTINKTLDEKTFHNYATNNDIKTWYSKITLNFDVNVNSGTIYSINNHYISFHNIGTDNLNLDYSISDYYYKILGGGSHMLVSYSYSMRLTDNNGNPKYFPGNFDDVVFFYAQ